MGQEKTKFPVCRRFLKTAAREEAQDTLDVLMVDEAAQMSHANAFCRYLELA